MLVTKFAEQVKKSPYKLAIKGEQESFTYEELDRVSGRVARLIKQAGRVSDSVGLLLEHGPQMIVAILGALKAGKTYVPISADYPVNRISYMLSHAQAGLIVTNSKNEKLARELAGNNIGFININVINIDVINNIDIDIDVINTNPIDCENERTVAPGDTIAYIMFTSGSTGRPKGVIQTHKNVLYYTRNWTRLFSITDADRMTLFSSFCHDGSVQDMFSALLNGATLYPYDLKKREESGKLSEFLVTEKITIWHSVPSLFSYFCTTVSGAEKFPGLRFILLGGEPIREHEITTAGKLFPHSSLVNVYGQTESSVNSVWIIGREKDKLNGNLKLRIGQPLDETEILVVDPEGNEVDVLEQGELVICSDYLSPGYWRDPEATRKAFSEDEELGRLYWTGDLGRLLPGGEGKNPVGGPSKVNIEFLGRKDFQVKIRGFRIELGEIENQLLKLEQIKEAVVTARERCAGEKFLVAYYTPSAKNEDPIDVTDLKNYLKNELPDYMIPTVFMELDQFPLTQSKKIDRKALPEPVDLATQATQTSGRECVAPRTWVEEKVAALWAEILGLEKTRLSIDANFFELGGHSLKATIMGAKIHQAFAVKIPFAQMFESYTIRSLAEYITRNAGQTEGIYTAIEAAEEKEYYPLSSAQERLFFLQQMDLEGTGYNIAIVLELLGDLHINILTETFKKLIHRHESFRTSFHIIAGESIQKIHREVDFKLEQLMMEYQSLETLIKNFNRSFDLSFAPLLRVGLVKTGDNSHLLLLNMHHIISDGTSTMVLAREYMDLYSGKDIPPLNIQYKDYTLWQKNEKDALKKQAEWWLNEFSGEIPVLHLPLDYPRPVVQSFAGSRLIFETGAAELGALSKLVLEPGITATLYMALLSIYSILLAKLSGQEELVIGAPIANRSRPDLSPIIGMFVNTLALRVYPEGHKSFKEYLKEIKAKTVAAFENQEYPFEELVEKVDVNRDPGRNPLFDAAFLLQNIDFPTLEIPGLTLKPYGHDNNIAKFDLLLQAFEVDDGAAGKKLVGVLEYCTQLFKRDTIERFSGYFKRILSSVIEYPDRQIDEIEIISESEKKQLLIDFNNTAVDYPRDKTIPQLFAGQAEKAPDCIALVGAGPRVSPNDSISLTYHQLHEQANHLAEVLIEKGVLADDIVAIMMERSIDLIIGILGILKAGGAYLPIDPGYPQERIEYMLKDSGVRILINKSEIRNSKFETNPNDQKINDQNKKRYFGAAFVLNFDHLNFEFVSNFGFRISNFTSSNLAYLIYTSGSTGQPKGVLVTHRNVVRLVRNTNFVTLNNETRILQSGAPVFDATTFEIWGSLLNGGQLALVHKEVILEAQQLRRELRKQRINTLWLSAPLFNQLLQQDSELFAPLSYLLVGGDTLSPGHINRARRQFPNLKIINGYGPTENTTFSLTYLIEKEFEQNIPIGRPIANSTAYIYDKKKCLVPIGVVGELVVGGDGVALGYLNNPELTAEKFGPQITLISQINEIKKTKINKSFAGVKGELFQKPPLVIYKTGDLARWLADGNIEFMGRVDQQVKIRGFRVELGEIENHLTGHPLIKEAVVLVLDNESDKNLCAYIVLKQDAVETTVRGELKRYLETVLPDYMIPAFFVFVENMPLTLNGKINKDALPKPEIAGQNPDYTAPRGPLEEKMAGIWAEILNINTTLTAIGIDDNFFQLGGHSLKATLLAARIHQVFAVKIPLAQLFKNATIRALVEYIKQKSGQTEGLYIAIGAAEEKEYYPLSSAQERLFFLQQMDLEGIGYNIPIVLELLGDLHINILTETFKKLICRHESFRTSFHIIAEKTVQKIHREVDFKIEQLMMEHQSLETLIKNFNYSFDLSFAPLLRVGLVKRGDDRDNSHLLMLNMHHIISDGTSTMILAREFMDLYSGKDIPSLNIQYKDYALWQKSEKEALKKQAEWWVNEFSGEIPVLHLPLDYPRPAVQSFAGSRLTFETGAEELGALSKLVLEPGITATLYMALLSIYSILLAKLSGQEELVIGAPIANRRHPDLAPIIGMFVNTLALRVYPEGHKSFKNYLKEIKAKTVAAFENQEYPFEELVEKVAVNRDPGRNPLFDAAFLLQNIDFPTLEIPGLTLKPYAHDTHIAKFDLLLQAFEIDDNTGKKLVGVLEYCTQLFKRDTIERFSGYFKRILSCVIENPDRQIAGIEIISESEKKQLLIDFNNTAVDYPRDKTIPQLFAGQAEKAPDCIALVGAGSQTCPICITYRHLSEQSNHLAGLLIEKGVLADDIVAIMMERSIDLIIGIMGILKSGGAYLPIDVDYPQERIDYMLKDSGVRILINKSEIRNSKFETNPNDQKINDQNKNFGIPIVLNFDHLNFEFVSDFEFRASNFNPSNLSYIIYTSGSTGRPKGVAIEHRALVNLCHWHIGYYELTDRDHVSQYASCGFDASVWEIFPALTAGAALHIINAELRLDMEAINNFFEKHDIAVCFLPTPACRQFMALEQENRSLRILLTGGDKLQGYIKRNYRLYNNYGPTENTVVTTAYPLDDQALNMENIPIGAPIGNTQVYILGKEGAGLQPVGVAGELCITGDGLSRGYLNNPELTAEKFGPQITLITQINQIKRTNINKRFSGGPGGRLFKKAPLVYRTGDLARWLENGNIEFLGRVDRQLKIRGFRIEPGEIERRIIETGIVQEAVVIAKEETGGQQYLCAYVVTGGMTDISELGQRLAKDLPAYMIPATFMPIAHIPLTANGKIDWKALPEPHPAAEAGHYASHYTPHYMPPRDKVEQALVAIWSAVLQVKEEFLGIDTNFFAAGGHSLKAIGVIAQIHQALAIKPPVVVLFKYPTIRGLAEYIRQKQGAQTSQDVYTGIEPTEKKEYYLLSPAQKRMYLLQQMDAESTAYNLPGVFTVSGGGEVGGIDREKLEQAFRALIARHESLRTSFHMIVEEPVQRIHDHVEFKIEYYNVLTNFVRAFDLAKAPLLRAALINTAEKEEILAVDLHHIITDGASSDIVIRELGALYSGESLPVLKLQYRDFAEWQRNYEGQRGLNLQEPWWLTQFAGEIPVLEIPIDYPRPPVQTFTGDQLSFTIGKEQADGLNALASQEGVTFYMVLLAIFNIFLAKISGSEDIVTGTPAEGRRHMDLKNIIGMFVNTLALRNHPRGEISYTDFLRQVQSNTLGALENQDYPFEELINKVDVRRDTGRNPLFDVMFTFVNAGDVHFQVPGLTLTPYPYEYGTAKFDILLSCKNVGGELALGFQYCTRLFKRETVRRFTEYFANIVSAVLTSRDRKLKDIEIIPIAEKEQILNEFNNTTVEFPQDKTIPELFENQALRTPDRIALVGAGPRVCPVCITYCQLNEQSNHLAGLLIKRGVVPEIIVGIMVERSLEMVVGIFGILKAGGAYLPIDPRYPQERIDYMLKDSGTKILLTAVECVFNFHHSSFIIHHSSHSCHLAYLIYTSGSTGKPKGVGIEHRAVVNRLHWMQRAYPLEEKDVILQKTPFTFDVSVWELFWWSFYGARLYLLRPGEEKDAGAIIEAITNNHITTLHFVPSMLAVFLDYLETGGDPGKLKSLRRVFSSGEALMQPQVENFNRLLNCPNGTQLINLYGPTEATVDVSYYNCPTGEIPGNIPIGKPIDNIQLYIINKGMHLQPIGIPGELCIAGAGLARGYLNRPELTAEKFNMSYRSYMSYILYQTGDLARWLPSGNIEFLGRIDHQVKIRGFRIELGEIVTRLLAHEKIKEAEVIVKENKQGDKYLCAYFVPIARVSVDEAELKEFLSLTLPDYMTPAYFVELRQMPLTPNGKIDRQALPDPILKVGNAGPLTRLEKQLAEIWAEVLGLDVKSIGADDRFFELGGQSLKATIMTGRIQKTFHVKLALAEIFNQSTIRKLARTIKEKKEEKYLVIEPAPEKPYYAVSSAQKRLYILQQLNPDSISYNVPLAVQLEGDLDIQVLAQAFKQLIQRHEVLRTGIEMRDGQPVQVIQDEVDFRVNYDETGMDLNDFIKPFELSRPPLLRVLLVKSAERKHILIVDIHHIVTDGISNRLIAQEFMALCSGRELPPLKLRYRDFSAWQNNLLAGVEIKKQEEYWLRRFEGEIPQLNLPLDFPRPAVHRAQSDSVRFEINPELTAKIKEVSMETGATPYMVLLAVYTLLLSRYADQDDIIVGTGIAGRRHADLQNLVGMFVNMLAIRLRIPEEMCFIEFLDQVRGHAIDALDNQDYQFDELVNQLAVETRPGRNPLFDTQFTFQDAGQEDGPTVIPGLTLTPYSFGHNSQPFDLDLNAAASGAGISLSLNYLTALFNRTTIENMAGHFMEILGQCLENKQTGIKDINLSLNLVTVSTELNNEEVSGFDF